MRNNLEHSELDSGHEVRVMMFNTTYNNRPALETPIVMSTPKRTNNALYHLRERLEKQVQNSQGKPEKQISPTLEKLKMTPG
jgi:hypothetical protein